MVKKTDLIDLPEVARYKQRRRRFLCVLIVLLVAGAVAAQPLYHITKQWRARSLAREAIYLVSDSTRQEEAFAAARSAYHLAPQDPTVLRTMAQVLSSRKDWATSLAFWSEALQRDPQAAPETRRGMAEAALNTGDLDRARLQVAALLSHHDPSAADHLLAARLHRHVGEPGAAIQAARAAIQVEPQHDPAALFLSECLVADAATQDEGVQLLREIGERPSAGGLAALQRRSLLSTGDPQELRALAVALRVHPLAAEGHRLLALSLELRSAPEDRSALLKDATAHYLATSPEVLRQFASWLLGEGEPVRVLDLLPEERALTRKDLFLVRLDALAAEARWREILGLLERPTLPLEEASRHLYRARCLQEMGESGSARLAWRGALAAAGRETNLLQYVAAYAEKFGALDSARTAYRQLTGHPATARFAYDALLRLTSRDDTAATRDLLSEMAQRWPHDTALVNDLAYLNALLAEELPACVDKARELVRSAPGSLPHRTVLALAELRLGNPKAALQTYHGLEIDWAQAAPGSVVVYAATLQANGQASEAVELASLASADRLRPEEQELKAASQMSL